jgi:hypothetical protein
MMMLFGQDVLVMQQLHPVEERIETLTLEFHLTVEIQVLLDLALQPCSLSVELEHIDDSAVTWYSLPTPLIGP